MSQRSNITELEVWRIVGRLEGRQAQAEVAEAANVLFSGLKCNF